MVFDKGSVFPHIDKEQSLYDSKKHGSSILRHLSTTGKVSICQWETDCFFVNEPALTSSRKNRKHVSHLSIGLVRIGCCGGPARVWWSTFDISAKANTHYEPTYHECVEFKDGETFKEVIVQITPRKEYDGTIEFGLYLEPDSAMNCIVGKYLHTSTVKIIDADCFPTEDLRKDVEGGDMKKILDIPPVELLQAFRVAAMQDEVVRRGTIRTILAHQFNNVAAALNVAVFYLVVELLEKPVDDLTAETKREKRASLLWFYAALYIIPFAIQHFLSWSQNFWRVGGGLRKQLQVMLLRRYLNYTVESRGEVTIERLVLAMTRDVVDVVADGYITYIDLHWGTSIKSTLLVAGMFYLSFNPTETTTVQHVYPVVAVLVLPFAKYAFVSLLEKTIADIREKQHKSEHDMINFVIKAVINFELVDDYSRRSQEVDEYSELIDRYNKASIAYGAYLTNAKFFAPWVTRAIIGAWLIVGGNGVLNQKISVAVFISTIGLFKLLGQELDKAFALYLRIISAYLSLAEITMYMNLEIDVPEKLSATRIRQKVGRVLRSKQRQLESMTKLKGAVDAVIAATHFGDGHVSGKIGGIENSDAAIDNLPIQIRNVDFSYSRGSDKMTSMLEVGDSEAVKRMRRSTIRDLNFEIPQGKLVAIVGPKSEGKATLLRLIAGSIFPRNGESKLMQSSVFVPPHLRIVQVHENPTILGPKETIYDNLVYGVKRNPNIDEPTFEKSLEERALGVLKRLEAGKDIISNLKTPGYLGLDGMRITRTDRQIIHLARAFVTDPELLLIYKPTNLLDQTHTDKAIALFNEFIKTRGALLSEKEPAIMRRKRTIIFTASSADVAAKADIIFAVRNGYVKLIRGDEHMSNQSTPKKELLSPILKNSLSPTLKLPSMEENRRGAKEEAKRLKKEIQSWLNKFKEENKREATTEDKQSIKELYDRYFLAIAKSNPCTPSEENRKGVVEK